MKFTEQIGYSSDKFSNAESYSTIDPDEMARLRTQSAVPTNPFMAPAFTEPLPRPQSPEPEQSDTYNEDEDLRPENALPVEEVDWVILPIDESDPRTGGPGDERARTPIADEPEHIQKLIAFALEWGNGSYRAQANIEASDGTAYEAVILPAVIGGIAVEHALVDTPEGDNALFAWRAEKGFRQDENDITWREVFRDGKKHAEAMGARRIYHTPTTDNRIKEYFARDEADLDKPFKY